MKNRSLVFFIVGVIITFVLSLNLADLRVNNAEKQADEKMINQLNSFLNAVDQQLFVTSLFSKRQNRMFERFQRQLSVYESYFTEELLFSIELKNNEPVIAISTNSNHDYMIGAIYPLTNDVITNIFDNLNPLVIKEPSKRFPLACKVFVPMLIDEQHQIKMVAVLELNGGPLAEDLKSVKNQTIRFLTLFFLMITLVGGLLIWRDGQDLEIKKRLKHIETVSMLIISLWILSVVTFIYEKQMRKGQEIAFMNYADNYATNMRNALRNIRINLENFAVFAGSIEQLDSLEFVSYSNQVLKSNAFESLYYFETSDDTASSDQIMISTPTGNNYFEKFISSRKGGVVLPAQLSKHELNAIEEIVFDSEKDNLLYGTDLMHFTNNNDTSHLFVLCVSIPFKENVNRTSTSKKAFIGALINPDYLLSHTFKRNEWLKRTIAIGLTQSLKSSSYWVATYPPEHRQHHSLSNYENHLKEYKYLQTYPIFIWGKLLGLTTHSMPDFENQVTGFSTSIIITVGILISLVMTVLVFLLKERWTIMEAKVSQRTKNLDRRIRDLTCIRNVSTVLQSEKSDELKYSAILSELEETLATQNNASISIEIGEKCYQTITTNKNCITKLSSNILSFEKIAGQVYIKSCKEVTFQKEDAALIQQISALIGDYLSHQSISNALQENELKFRSLVENAFDAIYTLEGKQFTYVNKAFTDMVEYTNEELTSDQFDLDQLLTDKSREIVQQRFLDRKNGVTVSHRYEFQQKSKTNRIIEVEASTVSVRMGGKTVIIGMLHDITDRKKSEMAIRYSEERLQQQNEELQVLNEELSESNAQIKTINTELVVAKEKAEASDKLKTAFLNNISHELRTPLNGILGATIVLTDDSNTAEERKEMASIVQQSSERLIRTITQYVDISLLNSGSMPLYLEEINIRELLRPFIESYTNECIKKQIKFDFDIKAGINEVLISDKDLLQKIVHHLLDNAVKFTNKGSIQCHFSFVDGGWEFMVKDTGIGIDPDFHSKIYNLFMQEDNSNVRAYDGNGLGMPIAKKACDLLGADIKFESAKGQGTTFIVRLKGTQEEKSIQTTQNNLPMTENSTSPLVLIAEDEDSNYIVLSMLLTKRINARVIRAKNGEEAVDLCSTHADVKLVLMDIKMPVMDGYEATALIKKNGSSIPIIAITAFGLAGDEHKALSAGCDDYLAKPIQAQQLMEKVVKWL
ncbi:MAG: two-component system chemotaxis family sensor kinase CheA [Bacteroidetes bacterium]|nr:MAG: two-component system chemotaxis family sensor kinase CheA [Bacteroidota bacterium]